MELTLAEAIAAGPVVLDGGLSTHLETMGHDLSGTLWSARLLADDPGAITAAHDDFFTAGAQVATSATYQASFEGFASVGLDAPAAEQLMRRGVELAVAARDSARTAGHPARWAAVSVGPYGAMLADGSEYRGYQDVSMASLRAWHRRRLAVFADTGADVLAIETLPCAAEVEAVVAELTDIEMPAWISVTGVLRDGVPSTAAGEPLAEVFAMAREADEVLAVGVNCCDPRDVAEMVAAATDASGKPGVVYPNRGEVWDGRSHQWVGEGQFKPELVQRWLDAGAALVGGCCRVEPEAIAAIRAHVAERLE